MTYKQDFYGINQKEIDDLFLEYLAPVIEYLEHPALIEEWIQKHLDAAAYKKNLHKDEKLPSMKNKTDRNIKQNTGQKS